MKITQSALQTIRGNIRLRTLLALEFDKHIASVDRWIMLNESNSELTTIKALQFIREETGLTDNQILEEDTVSEPQS